MSLIRYLGTTLGLVLMAAPASAHKLLVECRVMGDRVRVEAFYDDDSPAQQARIVVETETLQVVAEGKTDDRGLWSFPLPAAGNFRVRAESVGHTARETLVVSDKAKKHDASASIPTAEDKSSGSFVSPSESSEDHSRGTRSSRDEKTTTPWLRIGVGFAVITALCVVALVLRKRRHSLLPSDR